MRSFECRVCWRTFLQPEGFPAADMCRDCEYRLRMLERAFKRSRPRRLSQIVAAFFERLLFGPPE